MRPGQIGGLLLVGGGGVFLVALAIASTGGAMGLGVIGVSGTLVLVALLLAGFGCAVIAAAGPPPVCGRVIRACLGAVGAGLLSLSFGSALAGMSSTDPLASGPIVVLIVAGLAATLLGIITTGVTLVVAPWSSNLPGIAILIGIVCVALGAAPDGALPAQGALGTIGLVAIVLGGLWIGVTAFRGEGSPAVA